MPFALSHRKATPSLNFMARQAGGSIHKLKVLKRGGDEGVFRKRPRGVGFAANVKPLSKTVAVN